MAEQLADRYSPTAHMIASQQVADAKAAMAKLTSDERMEVMGAYCKHCGSTDPGCQCWNDE